MPTRTLASPPQRKPPVASPPLRRAVATPAPHRVQQLQRSLGNAGTLALLQGKGGHAPAVTADSARPAAQTRASGAAPGAAGGMQAGLSATLASIRTSAEAQKAHQPGEALVASAQSAAKEPALEQQRSASRQTVARLADTPPGQVERSPFRAQLRAAVEKAMPQPANAADAAKLLDEAAPAVSQVLRNALPTHREGAAGPLQGAARAEAPPVGNGPSTPAALQRDTPAPRPALPRAEAAIPPRLPGTTPDCDAHRQPADQALAREGLGDAQLARGREPAFSPVQQARATASAHDQGARRHYRRIEANIRAGAMSAARADLGQGLAGMHAIKTARHGAVAAHQAATRAKDAAERQRVTQRMGEIKTHTLKDVEQILGALENEAGMRFEIGLKQAEDAYGAAFAEARGGLGTWLGTWGESWREHIHKALVLARTTYMRHVDAAIDAVATYVEAELQRARRRVLDGRRELEHYVAGLDARLRGAGAEALAAVTAEFANMATWIDAHRDDLVERLTLQYTASRERLAETEQTLKDENRSLWDKAYAASLGVVEQVAAFRAMLLGILGEAGSVIGLILADPLGFLGKLVTAVRLGLGNFVARIREHLQKGLMDWLFGVMADAGIQMPERFDLQGVTSIVLQVVGLTYAHIRSRAVAIVGEATVARLEKTAEFFQILLREGMPGLARMIREKLTELKTTVVDAVFDFIREKVIGAGITWILSLLNPASAFFKACKAIYDILSFFVERASSLAALARSIVASAGAIARGALGPAATWIENALARSIPIGIGFLAGLLGLGDVAGSIRKLIDKARGPVNRAVDWGVKHVALTVRNLNSKKGHQQESLPDVNLIKPFHMGKHLHTLTVTVTNNQASIVMASRGPDLLPRLAKKAIAELGASENITPKDKIGLRYYLEHILEESRHESLLATWKANGSKGDFERWTNEYTTKIIEEHLIPLGKRGFNSLKDFSRSIPEIRFLPGELQYASAIRNNLYISANEWRNTADELKEKEQKKISKKVEEATIELEKNRGHAEKLWEELMYSPDSTYKKIKGYLIPSDAKLGKYRGSDVYKQEMEVDHHLPLAEHWNEGGYNQGDAERLKAGKGIPPYKIELVTRGYNRKKGSNGAEYRKYVGPEFSSERCKSPPMSWEIKGYPFWRTMNGPAITEPQENA